MTAAAVGKIATPGSPEYLAAAIALAALSGLVLLALGVAAPRLPRQPPEPPGDLGLHHGVGHPDRREPAQAHPGHAGRRRHAARDRGARSPGTRTAPTCRRSRSAPLAIGFLFWVRARLKPLLLAPRAAPAAGGRRDQSRADRRRAGDDAARSPGSASRVTACASWATSRAACRRSPCRRSTPRSGCDLLPAAVLISLVGFVESVSVAQTLAAKRRQRIDPDQELVALGAANVAAAFSGGYPVTGGFARSVVNFDAGAETPMAGVLTAVGIALTAAFLTPLFFNLPTGDAGRHDHRRRAVPGRPRRDPAHLRLLARADFTAMAATILVVLAGRRRGRASCRRRGFGPALTSGAPAGRTWRSSARCRAPSTSATSCATR